MCSSDSSKPARRARIRVSRLEGALIEAGQRPTEVLHDVRMIEVLEKLDLRLERVDREGLTVVRLVRSVLRLLHLLDGEHLSHVGVESEVDTAVLSVRTRQVSLQARGDQSTLETHGALADEVALDPFED